MNADNLLGLLNFVAVSIVGWKIFSWLRIPAASVLGGMALVAAANLLSVPLYLPPWLRFVMSVNLGISIGSKYDVRISRGLLLSVLSFVAAIVVGSLTIAWLVESMGIERGTAIFAYLLGGLTELSFLAQEFAFDSFLVSLFQLARMCMMLIFIPIIGAKLPKAELETGSPKSKLPSPSKTDWVFLVLLAVALVEVLTLLKVPAGKMIGAALSTAVYSAVRKIKPRLNASWHSSILALIGGSTGLSVDMQSLLALRNVVAPLSVYLVAVIAITFLIFLVLHNIGKLDARTSLFSSALGGLAPTIAMAETLGADSSIVSTFQVIRYFSVIALALMLGYIS